MTRLAAVCFVLFFAWRTPLAAQLPIRGQVLASENDQPLSGAEIYALRSRRGAETDRHGRFVLWLRVIPDTLIAHFIGRAPDTVVVSDSAAAGGAVVFHLQSPAVALPGVTRPRALPGHSRARRLRQSREPSRATCSVVSPFRRR